MWCNRIGTKNHLNYENRIRRIQEFGGTVSIASWADPGGGRGQGVQNPPRKFQVAISFLNNTGMDTPKEAIGPLRSNCFFREVGRVPCEMP